MGAVLGHILVEEVEEVSHSHHGLRVGLRRRRSGESGWMSGLMVDG